MMHHEHHDYPKNARIQIKWANSVNGKDHSGQTLTQPATTTHECKPIVDPRTFIITPPPGPACQAASLSRPPSQQWWSWNCTLPLTRPATATDRPRLPTGCHASSRQCGQLSSPPAADSNVKVTPADVTPQRWIISTTACPSFSLMVVGERAVGEALPHQTTMRPGAHAGVRALLQTTILAMNTDTPDADASLQRHPRTTSCASLESAPILL